MSALSQHLEAIGHQWDALDYVVNRLSDHARDLPHADGVRILNQLELEALTTCAKAVLGDMDDTMTALDMIADDQAVSESRSHETAVFLTKDEHQRLSAIAEEWKMGLDTAASRIVMQELQRRFGMPGGPKKAA